MAQIVPDITKWDPLGGSCNGFPRICALLPRPTLQEILRHPCPPSGKPPTRAMQQPQHAKVETNYARFSTRAINNAYAYPWKEMENTCNALGKIRIPSKRSPPSQQQTKPRRMHRDAHGQNANHPLQKKINRECVPEISQIRHVRTKGSC